MSGPPRDLEAALAALDRADSVWNDAIESRRHADPFCCRTEWQLSFHEAIAAPRPLLVEARADSVLAFAHSWHPSVGYLLEPIDNSWLFGCPLLGEGAVARLHELVASASQPLSMLISGVRRHGTLRRELERTFRHSHELLPVQRHTGVTASLRGGLDGFLSRRSAKLRRNLRAAVRRAHAAGIRFERHQPSNRPACDALYERILAVEARSWKGIGRCGMAEEPSRTFYRVLLRRLSKAQLARIVIAQHPSDGDIGFIFGGMHRRIYRGQQFSFVDRWRQASLGNVLQHEKVAWLCEQGAHRYDMGPVMPYKLHWTETRLHADSILLRSTAS